MAVNYGYEYKKFRKNQERQREWYLEQGMSEEAIKDIEAYDYKEFLSMMREKSHTQSLDTFFAGYEDEMCDESKSALFKKFSDVMTVTIDYGKENERYDWMEEIENVELYKAIHSLSKEQIELLTMSIYEGYKNKEIASILNIPESTISYRLVRIYKKLREISIK